VCLWSIAFLWKKNTYEAKAWLDKLYFDSAPAKSTVEKWFAKLKRGKMCIEGDAHYGRLQKPRGGCLIATIASPPLSVDTRKRLFPTKSPQNNFEWSYSEVDRDSWDFKEMCWTYCAWIFGHIFDDSEQCLAIFNRNKDEFFSRYITMDVTWLLHNTPTVSRVDWTRWTESKAWKDVNCRQYYGMRVV
jgi:hypothetical protein